MVWTDGTHVVRSPLQANLGTSVTAPSDLAATTVSGSRTFTIGTGFGGKLTALKGMKDVTLGAAVVLTANPNVNIGAACSAGATLPSLMVYNMAVPAGAIVARFALRQADVSGPQDDNDLAVVAPNGAVTTSGGGTSHETLELLNPAAGNYRVCVQAYASPNPTMTHQLSSWIVKAGDTAGGAFNVLVASTVYAGGSSTAGMSWSGLAASHRYLGGAQFIDASGAAAAATALYIDTTPGTPLEVITPTSDSKDNVTKK